MKTKKAKSWEQLSEGIITAGEIRKLEEDKDSITMVLQSTDPQKIHVGTSIKIVPRLRRVRNSIKTYYDVVNNADLSRGLPNNTGIVNKNPYKYLSCAVRKAVKEYKVALWTKQWKALSKV